MDAIRRRLHWAWSAKSELIFRLREGQENNGDDALPNRLPRRRNCCARASASAKLAHAFHRGEECACCWRSRMRLKRTREHSWRRTAKDIESSGLEGAMRDRLLLTPERIKEMAQGVRDVAALRDPIGETLAEWTRPTACAFARCACRWGWLESFTNRGPTLPSIRPCLR